MNPQDMHTQLLMDIGLSKLKARVYLVLLEAGKSTGYQVAKKLNEPVANTYKALESLQKEGLIFLDESTKVKYYTALPISHYLDQMELRFSNKREVIEKAIKPLETAPPQEGIYKIESREQLYTQASTLIERGRDIIAVDSSSLPIEQIKNDLQRAAKKGKTVLIKSYEEIEIPDCTVVFSEEMGSPVSKLPIGFLHLVVPGVGYITAMLDQENRRLLNGIFAQGLFLSIVAYNGFTMEFFVTKAFNMLHQGRPGEEVLKEFKKLKRIASSSTAAWEEFIESITSKKGVTGD